MINTPTNTSNNTMTPDHEALSVAQELVHMGRAPEARAILERQIRSGRDTATLRYALGIACQFAGASEDAVAAYRLCIQLDPKNAGAHNNLGALLLAERRYEEAIACLRTAVQLNPDYVRGLSNLGKALHDSGNSHEGVTMLADAVRRFPSHVPARLNYGSVLADLARHAEAREALQRAVDLEPGSADAHYLLGRAQLLSGAIDEALASLAQALRLKPTHRDARLLLADALDRAGRTLDAVQLLRETGLEDLADPTFACVLADYEYRSGDLTAALASYDRALTREPESLRAWRGRGHVLEMLRRYSAAVASYQRALELDATEPLTLAAALICDQWTCDWSSAEHRYTALRGIDGGLEAIDPWILLGVTDDPAEQLRVSEARARALNRGLTPFPGRKCCRRERLRVAYLSNDFREHATAQLIAELIELHDRSLFEVCGISLSSDEAAASTRVVRAFDQFVDVRSWSDRAVAEWVRAREIDVLVDLKGYTYGARTRILGYRAAPVQVSFLGYPGTMGNPAVDYIVADEHVITATSRPYFTEAVAYLPDCYQPNDRQRARPVEVAPEDALNLPADQFVFCSFNNNWKISRSVFRAWMQVLADVDDSVLWLLGDNPEAVANLRSAAVAARIAPERLVFSERTTYLRHLARYVRADLFLDTWPCNAHTTCSEALWMGVPVLTCAGRGFAGRVAASLVSATGLGELVAESSEQYVALAVDLARDRPRLAAIRLALRKRVATAPLFDTPRFCRNLESAYLRMHELAADGQPPRDFQIAQPRQ